MKAQKKKYGCSQSEKKILKEIANELGLIEKEQMAWCRHPLAYLMEAADDICYALIDLEDGIELGFVTYEEVIKILTPVVDFDEISPFHPSCGEKDSRSRTLAIARGRAINVLIDGVVDTFIQQKDYLLNGSFMYDDIFGACEGRVKECIDLAKNTARSKIFHNPRKLQLEIGSHTTIEILLESFIKATYTVKEYGNDAPYKHKQILELMGNHKRSESSSLYYSYMGVLDFISGMTDNYATYIAKQLTGMAK